MALVIVKLSVFREWLVPLVSAIRAVKTSVSAKVVNWTQSLSLLTLLFGALFFAAASNISGLWTASHAGIPLLSNSAEAVAAFEGGDAGAYLELALQVNNLGIQGGAVGYSWVFNHWAPGMVFFDFILVNIEAWTGVPYLLLLVLAGSTMWGFTLASLHQYLSVRVSSMVALTVSTFLLLSSLWAPFGTSLLAYGDGFATCGGLLAILYLARASENQYGARRARFLALSTIALTFALYMRTVYETITLVTFTVAVLGLVLTGVVHVLKREQQVLKANGTLISLLSVSFFSLLLTVPWRLLLGLWIRPGEFSWSLVTSSNSPIWSQRWMSNEVLEEQGLGWMITSGVNYGCRVDADRCQQIYDAESSTANPYSGSGEYSYPEFFGLLSDSIIEMPIAYLVDRLNWFFLGFFSRTGSAVGDFAITEGVLLLIAMAVVIVAWVRKPGVFEAGFGLGLMQITVMSVAMAAIHMETRYMAGIKMTIVALFALSVSHLVRVSSEDGCVEDSNNP